MLPLVQKVKKQDGWVGDLEWGGGGAKWEVEKPQSRTAEGWRMKEAE